MVDYIVRPGTSGVQSSSAMLAITPADGTDLPYITRGIWVGGTGDLSVLPAIGGAAVVIPNVLGGTQLPISVTRIRSTGTTATGIVAFF